MAQKNNNQLSESSSIEQSLKQIANCLAYLAINSGELKERNRQDVMGILSSWGFDRLALASLFQTSPEVVSQTLYMLRSSKKTSRSKKQEASNDGENKPGPAK